MNLIKTDSFNSMHTEYKFIISDYLLQKLQLSVEETKFLESFFIDGSPISQKLLGLSLLASKLEQLKEE